MKELCLEFDGRSEMKNYSFRQIKKNDSAYIYEVKNKLTSQVHYEVFQRRYNSLYDCISYPNSKSFGIWAYSCMSLDKANNKFNLFSEKK